MTVAGIARRALLVLLMVLASTEVRADPSQAGLPWVQARPLGIQAEPSWESARLGWLKAGERARILDSPAAGWLHVRAGAVTGYVDRDWIHEEDAAPAGPGMAATTAATGALPFLRFESLGTAQGLPDTTVTAICQDKDGFLWFGTEGGLARFDGYEFRPYLHDPKNPGSLVDSYIRTLLADPSGTIWVGTGEGLQALSPRKGTFEKTFRQDPANPASLSHNVVTALLRDAKGQLWVGTEGGVCRLDPASNRIERFPLQPIPEHKLVRSVAEVEPGRLWVAAAGEDGGSSVTELDLGKKTQRLIAAVSAESGETADARGTDPDGFAWSASLRDALARTGTACTDREGDVWFGTTLRQGARDVPGVIRRDRKRRSYTAFDLSWGLPKETGHALPPTSVHEDRWGDIWIGLAVSGGGLVRLERETGRLTRYTHQPLEPESLHAAWVRALFEDRGGVLWIGTEAFGASKVGPLRFQDNFAHWKAQPEVPESLMTNKGGGLLVDRAGVLWISSEGGGLSAFDRRTGHFTHYRYGPQAGANGLSSDRIWKIYQDRAGELWLGSFDGKLQNFDPVTRTGNTYDISEWGSVTILDLFDSGDGSLWVATFGVGLLEFDLHKRSFRVRYTTGGALPCAPGDAAEASPATHPALHRGPSSDVVFCIRQDQKRKDVLWLGTELGLNRLDRSTGEFRYFTKEQGLSYNAVFDVMQDADGSLWLGTGGGGLSHFDPRTEKFQNITTSDGLPSNNIYGILADEANALWISSNQGLTRLDKSSRATTNFGIADGLQDLSFAQGIYAKDPKTGEMFFGGRTNGFNSFWPASIRQYRFRPPVVLSGLQLYYKDRDISEFLDDAGKFTIAHNAVTSFKLAALSFASPRGNNYRYRLSGLGEDWVDLGGARTITFQNLPAGDYELCVSGSNHCGAWNEDGFRLRMHVLPPWWRSSWAYGTYALLSMLLMIAAVRYQEARLDRLRQVNRLAEVERSLEITGTIQTGFLPRETVYRDEQMGLVGLYQAADSASGDWWWHQKLGEDSHCVLVGDVTGHGAGPAMLTASMAAAFRVLQEVLTPADLPGCLKHVNNEVVRIGTEHLIALTAVELNRTTGRLKFIGAGGLAVLRMSPDGEVRTLGRPGTPLGTKNFTLGMAECSLVRGERCMVMTDGYPELALPGGQQLGKKEAKQLFVATRHLGLEESLAHIVNRLQELRCGTALNDDVTIVLLEWTGALEVPASTPPTSARVPVSLG